MMMMMDETRMTSPVQSEKMCCANARYCDPSESS